MRRWRGLLLLLAALAAGYVGVEWDRLRTRWTEAPGGKAATGAAPAIQARPIAIAFRDRLSSVMVEARGEVIHLLPDDRHGSAHQRFIVRLDDGQTVLIAHNIDLAPRLPLGEGDTVHFRGEYEWNVRGGVVHWTHRTASGPHPHGWIRHRGRVYE